MKTSVLFLIACLVANLSFGEGTWDNSALNALQQGDSEGARQFAKPHADSRPGQILLFAAYAQEYDHTKSSKAMTQATQAYRDLLPEVAVDDVAILQSLRKLKGSILHSFTETLLDQAMRRVETPEQAKAVPDALKATYPRERYKIYAGLSQWLSTQRAKLLNGKSLDAETQEVFTDPVLIATLVDMLEVKKPTSNRTPRVFASPPPNARGEDGARPPTPSKMQPPRTNATARECLLLIEEPAIPLVLDMLPTLGDEGVSLLSELNAAKSLRRSKAPDFSWIMPDE